MINGLQGQSLEQSLDNDAGVIVHAITLTNSDILVKTQQNKYNFKQITQQNQDQKLPS